MDNPAATPRSAPPMPPSDSEPEGDDGPSAGSIPSFETDSVDSTGPTSASSEPAATTTTAVPLRPTSADVELLAFAQTFEYTARDLYQAAIDAGAAEGDAAAVFQQFLENHEGYANLIAGIIGVDAPQRRDDALYDDLLPGFDTSDTAAVVQAGYELESTAVATHTALMGQLEGLDGATAIVSMLVVEARQCTVLVHLAGNGDDMAALLENDAEALVPAGSAGG